MRKKQLKFSKEQLSELMKLKPQELKERTGYSHNGIRLQAIKQGVYQPLKIGRPRKSNFAKIKIDLERLEGKNFLGCVANKQVFFIREIGEVEND